MRFTQLLLVTSLLCGAGCSSDEKTDEKTKTAEPKAAKDAFLVVGKEDTAIVELIDQLATKAGYEIFIEADVAGTLTPKEQGEINSTFGPKEDYKGAIAELAKRAKCVAKEEKTGEKVAFRFVKE